MARGCMRNAAQRKGPALRWPRVAGCRARRAAGRVDDDGVRHAALWCQRSSRRGGGEGDMELGLGCECLDGEGCDVGICGMCTRVAM